MSGAVAVCADRSAAAPAALRWAARAARDAGRPLHVLVPDEVPGRAAGPSAFTRALDALRAAAPDLPVLAHAGAPAALRARSAEAALLVVPATLDDVDRVVEQAFCTVVVVPEDATAPDGPVVLAAAPHTGEEVYERAFTEARRLGAPLLAVRAWREPAADLARFVPGQIARWDAGAARARRELDLTLRAWAIGYPDVAVEPLVAEDTAADLLADLSGRARLVVLGRSTRGALLGGLAASPVRVLAHAAGCPVTVVAGEGPPRRTWLPDRPARPALRD